MATLKSLEGGVLQELTTEYPFMYGLRQLDMFQAELAIRTVRLEPLLMNGYQFHYRENFAFCLYLNYDSI